MNITQFLKKYGIEHTTEGHCQEVVNQMNDLISLTAKPNCKIMEIGFNGGHSAEIFLQHNLSSSVVSFDIGCHRYVCLAKQYMDVAFPKRHMLILGNSIHTVPKYADDYPDRKFDVIFVDGNHEYDTAILDLKNCMRLAHKDTIIIMDDTIHKTKEYEAPWTKGPTKAWKELVNNNIIHEINTNDYQYGKGLSWGKYVFDQ